MFNVGDLLYYDFTRSLAIWMGLTMSNNRYSLITFPMVEVRYISTDSEGVRWVEHYCTLIKGIDSSVGDDDDIQDR